MKANQNPKHGYRGFHRFTRIWKGFYAGHLAESRLYHEQERCLIQLAADNRLDTAQRAELDAHLSECAECRAYAEEIHVIEAQLSSVSHRSSPTRLVSSSSSIQKRYRRYQMNKQTLSIAGTLAAIAGAIIFFVLFGRIIPSQHATAAEQTRVANETATTTTTATPTLAPPTSTPPNTTHLTIAEVEALAGFEIISPTWLPDGYTLESASYNPEKNVACLLYRTLLDSDTPASLIVAQSPAGPLPPLEAWLTPNYLQEFGERALFEQDTIYIAGAIDGRAIYIRSSLDPESYCQHNGLGATKAIVWQTEQHNFVVYGEDDFYLNGNFLTTLEMQRIAEGLTGISSVAPDVADLERLSGIHAAQALAGFPLRQPMELPGDYEFLYAQYEESEGEETVRLIYRHAGSESDANGMVFSQSTSSAKMLDDLEIYEEISIHGESGLFSPGVCWDEDSQPFADCGAPQALEWSEGDMHYNFSGYFDKESILASAESLAYTGLSVDKAEALAGFEIKQPAKLPEGYSFNTATYDPKTQTITIIHDGPVNETGFGGFGLRVSANITETLDMQYNAHPKYYERITLRGQPGLYFQGCWNNEVYEHDCNGSQYITWFEDDLKYSLSGVFSNDTAKAFLSAIAEDMALSANTLATPPPGDVVSTTNQFTGIWYTNIATFTLTAYGDEMVGEIEGYGGSNSETVKGKIQDRLLDFGETTLLGNLAIEFNAEATAFKSTDPELSFCGARSTQLPVGCGFSGKWFLKTEVFPQGSYAVLTQTAQVVTGTIYTRDGNALEEISGNMDWQKGWALATGDGSDGNYLLDITSDEKSFWFAVIGNWGLGDQCGLREGETEVWTIAFMCKP